MPSQEVEVIRRGWRNSWRHSGHHSGKPLFEHVKDSVAERGDDEQVFVAQHDTRTFTSGQLYEQGLSVASALLDSGIGTGDVVAVHMANVPEAIISYVAVHAIGATLVPIPSIYSDRETSFILSDSHARVLITAAEWRGHTYLQAVPGYLAQGELQCVIVVGSGQHNYQRFADLLKVQPQSIPALPQRTGETAAAIIYTSGSTARPKGVVHSDDTLVFETLQNYPPDRMDGSVWLNAVPAGHMGGYLSFLRLMLVGRPGVWMERWDPSVALSLIQTHAISSGSLVPFHLMTLLELMERQGVDRLFMRDALSGSTTVPTAVIENAARHGLGAYRCYGSTEHPTISKADIFGSLAYRSQTDGALMSEVTVKVVADDGTLLPDGCDGEIISRGPDQFLGYTSEADNLSAFTADGYFRTGDIGNIRSGILTITGRKKDVIIRGGENISVQEIEELLRMHPDVLEAAVVPRLHDRYGEQVWAFLRTKENRQLKLEDVRLHFRRLGVARQKTPEGVVVLEEFPRTAAGKVAKRDLRESLGRSPR